MRNRHILHSLILFLFLVACSKVPVTNRKQLNLLPESQVQAMGFQAYSQFLSTHQVSNNATQQAMVRNVGSKIQNAVETYMRQNGLSSRLEGYKWEFNLIEDPAVNAFALPGGKVAVFTGILPLTQTEAGLAAVIGHEIAHNIAQHGNERMSQGLVTQLGGVALSVALADKPQQTQQLFMAAYGLGSQVGYLLPYSRLHETEADRLGLIFMAMAGYNPEEAIPFWQRMAQKSGPSVPEIVSTHPSDETRLREIRRYLPEAMKYYKR